MSWFADEIMFPPLSAGHFIARSEAELTHMVRHMQSASDRAFDFETNGLRFANPSKHPIGYGLGYIASDGRPYAWYVPVAHKTPDLQADPAAAKRAFADALKGAKGLIGHHLKYDINVARAAGWEVPEDVPLHDTLSQAYLCYEKRAFALESLAAETPGAALGRNPFEMKELHDNYTRERAKLRRMTWKKDKPNQEIPSYLSVYGHEEVPVLLEGEYCCRDIDHTLMLDRIQRSEAMGIGQPWEYQRRYLYDNEMLLVRALADVEFTGQPLDADYLREYASELDEELAARADLLSRMFGASIDFANDNEVRDLLYGHLKLPIPHYTPKSAYTAQPVPAVDQSALLKIKGEHPGIEHLIDYSLRVKVRTTYTRSLAFRQDPDGRVHASFKIQGTKSGRLSGSDPNLQNIPIKVPELAKRIRQGFPVEDGMARVYLDYSQIELRMLAWVTGSKPLTQAYASPAYMALVRGEIDYDTYRRERVKEPRIDAHGAQAKAVFGVDEAHDEWKFYRRAAKVINFGVSYGMSALGLTSHPDLQLPVNQAKEFFASFHETNPEIDYARRKMISSMVMNAGRGQPFFINWAGRKVHGPGLTSSIRSIKSPAERSAFASLIQGSAGELTRFSLVACWRAMREGRLPARATSTVHDEIQFDCKREDVPVVVAVGQEIMEDTFRGRFATVPVVADAEVTYTNWAEKKEIV